MGKRKRKLTAAEKRAKREQREKFEWIFINGKQKRVKRQTVEGLDVDEFIRCHADPIWLHQEGLWEYLEPSSPLEEPEVPFEECPF